MRMVTQKVPLEPNGLRHVVRVRGWEWPTGERVTMCGLVLETTPEMFMGACIPGSLVCFPCFQARHNKLYGGHPQFSFYHPRAVCRVVPRPI